MFFVCTTKENITVEFLNYVKENNFEFNNFEFIIMIWK